MAGAHEVIIAPAIQAKNIDEKKIRIATFYETGNTAAKVHKKDL